MNPTESILYPASYYRDMAFFVTKSMTNIFDDNPMSPSVASELGVDSLDDLPIIHRKSDTPVIAAAIDGHFSSDWEAQMYQFIHKVFRNSMLDESVVIGAVVLLDLLGDLHKMGQYMDGEKSKLVLPYYPHKDYLCYFMGAFMLSHRLINRKKKPLDVSFWEQVLGEEGIVTLGEVSKIETDFRDLLEEHINYYPPLPISPDDPAYQFHYAGDVFIPPNPFIPRLRYMKTKATMYAHIRVRMSSRGESLFNINPNLRGRKKELALHFPPCHEFMMEKFAFFQEARRVLPHLQGKSNKEVNDYLEAKCKEKQARRRRVPGLGLSGIPSWA